MTMFGSQWLANPDTGYEIDQSIRFNADDSAYLTRTPGSEGNRRTFTLSTWVKFNEIRSDNIVFASWISSGASSYALMYMHSDFRVRFENDGTSKIKPSMLFRDTAAWYHIVLRVDTTDSTANDRYQMYVNGERQTDLEENDQPAQDFQTNVNKTQPHYLGRNGYSLAMIYSDLYQAETHFIDGTALDCNSFGEFNSDTGQWIPKKYAGSYGSQGFYIRGEDSSDLGNDSSGNNNDLTSSGLTTADQMLDTPTNNFCVLSQIDSFGSGLTLSDGNLRAVPAASAYGNNHGTFYIDSGKWVFECKHTTVFGEACGWSPPGERLSGSSDRGYFMFSDGRAYDNTTNTGTKGASLASGDFRYVFYDADAQAMWFAHVDVSSSNALVYDNSATKAEIEAGTTTNAVFTSIPAGFWAPGIWMDTSGVIEVNFGQSAFATTSDLPSGFKTLSAANLPDPTIADPSKHFATQLYTGNNTDDRAITGYNFGPDWVWIKARNQAYSHNITDIVRGAGKYIQSNTTDPEVTGPGAFGSTGSFTSDGFTLKNGSSGNLFVNDGSTNYVAWAWEANGSGSSNSDGSITSTVSANTTSGFSIVSYSGSGSSGATVGHGLGADLKMIILKDRGVAENWCIFHEELGPTKFLYFTTDSAFTVSNRWNDTSPTSSVFTLGNETQVNGSGRNYIAYCFSEVESYSKFSSFVGNGSTDGPFVFTGFKPAWLTIKRASGGTGNWDIFDNQRDPFNVVDAVLDADASSAEATYSTIKIDFLSNGFKIRGTQSNINNSGDTYIYMALAETPFKTANAR